MSGQMLCRSLWNQWWSGHSTHICSATLSAGSADPRSTCLLPRPPTACCCTSRGTATCIYRAVEQVDLCLPVSTSISISASVGMPVSAVVRWQGASCCTATGGTTVAQSATMVVSFLASLWSSGFQGNRCLATGDFLAFSCMELLAQVLTQSLISQVVQDVLQGHYYSSRYQYGSHWKAFQLFVGKHPVMGLSQDLVFEFLLSLSL